VTNAQFGQFDPVRIPVGNAPRDRDPVTNISWTEAKAYCTWLAEQTGLPVRLPSESEWECACRAGSDGEFCFGDAAEELIKYGKHYAKHQILGDYGITEVGTRWAIQWGLYDLHGNVWEWCEDAWRASYEGVTRDVSSWIAEDRASVGVSFGKAKWLLR